MKIVIAVALAAALLATTGPASAAPGTLEKKVAALEKQMAAVRKQNATLKKQVAKLQKDSKDIGGIAALGALTAGCLVAVTADSFQGTWAEINTVAAKTVFPASSPLNDQGLCAELRVLRQPTTLPPTIAPFSALMSVFTSSVAPAWMQSAWSLPN
jgi:hypothetical protein